MKERTENEKLRSEEPEPTEIPDCCHALQSCILSYYCRYEAGNSIITAFPSVEY